MPSPSTSAITLIRSVGVTAISVSDMAAASFMFHTKTLEPFCQTMLSLPVPPAMFPMAETLQPVGITPPAKAYLIAQVDRSLPRLQVATSFVLLFSHNSSRVAESWLNSPSPTALQPEFPPTFPVTARLVVAVVPPVGAERVQIAVRPVIVLSQKIPGVPPTPILSDANSIDQPSAGLAVPKTPPIVTNAELRTPYSRVVPVLAAPNATTTDPSFLLV